MSRVIQKKVIALSLTGAVILSGAPTQILAEENIGAQVTVSEETVDSNGKEEQPVEETEDEKTEIEQTNAENLGEEGTNKETIEQVANPSTEVDKELVEDTNSEDASNDKKKEKSEVDEKREIIEEVSEQEDKIPEQEDKIPEQEQTYTAEIDTEEINVDDITIDYGLENYWTDDVSNFGIMLFTSNINPTDFTCYKSQLNGYELSIYEGLYENLIQKENVDGTDITLVTIEDELDNYLIHEENGDRSVEGTTLVKDNDEINSLLEGVSAAYPRALAAFLADYPEVCWLDVEHLQVSVSPEMVFKDNEIKPQPNKEDKLVVTYTMKYQEGALLPCYGSYDDVNAMRRNLQTAVEEISEKVKAEADKVEDDLKTIATLQAINDYIVKAVNYNSDAANALDTNSKTAAYANAWTAVGAFIDNSVTPSNGDSKAKVVCEGYSKAFKLVCDQLGIPCILVSGKGYNDPSNPGAYGPHMWNYVQVPEMEDGRWYLVDVTWNDANSTEESSDEYFMSGSSETSDHEPGNSLSIVGAKFTYPELSEDKFDTVLINTAAQLLEDMGFEAKQEDIANKEEAREGIEEKVIEELSDAGFYGISVQVEEGTKEYKEAIAGTKENPMGTAGSYSYIVTLTRGTGEDIVEVTMDEKEMIITAKEYVETEDDKNQATVNAAKTTVEAASFTGTQASITTEEAAKEAVENQLKALNLEVTAEVVEGSFTAAIAGTKEQPTGTAGSYTFKVKLTQGSVEETTETITMPIKATAYVGPSQEEQDAAAVSAAKQALKGVSFTGTQATIATEGAAKQAVENQLSTLNLGVTTEVEKVSFTAAVAGTKEKPEGTAGSYVFKVKLTKGSAEETTEAITMPITAAAYAGPSQEEQDAAAVNTAKVAVEGASFSGTQAMITNEKAAKIAIESKLQTLNLNGVTTEVQKVSYTAPVAGTSSNVSGVAGSYIFKVLLSKGIAKDTTVELTMPISANRYVTPSNSGSSSGSSSSSSSSSGSSNKSSTTTTKTEETKVQVNTTSTTTSNEGKQEVKTEVKVIATDDTAKVELTPSQLQNTVKSLQNQKETQVTLDISVNTSINNIEVKLPASTLKDMAHGNTNSLKLNTSVGAVTLNKETLEKMSQQGNSDCAISLKQDTESSHKTFTLKVETASNNQITLDKVTVELPYEKQANENQNCIVVYKVDAQGNKTIMPVAQFTSSTQKLTFQTNAACSYEIGYNEKAFKDTQNHWAKDGIERITALGIFNGTKENQFDPNKAMTKGMLVTVLNRLDISPKITITSNSYSDVKPNAWYKQGVDWAVTNNIAKGKDETHFGANDNVTRAELATMIANYISYMGIEIQVKDELNVGDLGTYDLETKEAIKKVIASGIMTGKAEGQFNPDDMITRAEVAEIMNRLIDLQLK